MRLLYSNMLPLKLGDGQTAFIDYFMDAVREADEIDIAVGYVSKAALKELQGLVDTAGIKRICLTMGMYYHEGMPEGTYNVAAALNEDWTGRGIGEVRLVRAFMSFIRMGSRFLLWLVLIIWGRSSWRHPICASMNCQW